MPAFLVLSDIHANFQALQAVFRHAQSKHTRPDAIWCLGDLVGYGPQPKECVDLLRFGPPEFKGVPIHCVRGNHDQGVINVDQNIALDGAEQVLKSWRWTAQELNPDQKKYLADLPTSLVFHDLPRQVRLVHAAPPESMDHYMLVAKHVEDMLADCPEQICFFGHTHLACYFECYPTRREARPRLFPIEGQPGPVTSGLPQRFLPAETLKTVESKAERLFVNPGSVGQPRWGRVVDASPENSADKSATWSYPVAYLGLREASYLWIEIEADYVRLMIHYVSYDVDKTLQLMSGLGSLDVPERWQHRLRDGLR